MQIFKLLPTVCAVVICANFISVRADDTPVQAAAREALERKMKELDAPQTQAPPIVVTSPGAVNVQPSQPATKTVPAKATTPAAKATTPATKTTTPAAKATTPATKATTPAAKVTTPAAKATTPQPTPMPVAPVAIEPQSPPAATTTPAPATPPPAETKPAPMMTPVEPAAAAATTTSETNAAPAASETTPAAPVATTPAEVTPATPPPTETKPEVLTPEMKPAPVIIKPAPPAITPAAGTVPQSPAMPATIKVKPGVKSATNQINAIFPGKELGLKPIESPLLPVSATQQAQLQALLIKYKANQITPEEYHNQRAEILAQP